MLDKKTNDTESIAAKVAKILNQGASTRPAAKTTPRPQTILKKYTPINKTEANLQQKAPKQAPTYKPLRVLPSKSNVPCGAHEYNRKDFGKY